MSILELSQLEEIDCWVVPTDLTIARAHWIMRIHAHYAESPCRQRRAALEYLVDAGHYKLSARSSRHR